MMSRLASSHILLIGASGFIGANLYNRFRREGFRVTATCRSESNLWRYEISGTAPNFEMLDVTNRASVFEVLEKHRPDVVIYLASTAFNPPPAAFSDHLKPNVIGLAHLLDAMRGRRDVCLIYTGSGAAAGSGSDLRENMPDRPTTQLGVAKSAASGLIQAAAQTHEVQAAELRLFTPFGPLEASSRAIPSMILAALREQSLDMTAGHQKRDFVFVDDVVDAFVAATQNQLPPGSIVNVSSGQSHSLRDMASLLETQMGQVLQIKWGALATRPDEIMDMTGPSEIASRLLGWHPKTSLQDGLAHSIQWFEKHLNAPGLG